MNATLLALAVTGAVYNIDWQADDLHLTGVVDTETDTLTWDALPEGLGSPVWPAVTRGEYSYTPEDHWEIVPYDVPDDWSGVLDGWGFLSDATAKVNKLTFYSGLGCTKKIWECMPNGYCYGQTLVVDTVDTLLGIQDESTGRRTYGPALVDVQPVSPARAVGDTNWDGLFNSSDLVNVLAIGKYHTGQPAIWVEGDWDQNGVFDSGDMVAAFVAGQYDRPAAARMVPEPSGWVLLLWGWLIWGNSSTRKE